MSNFYSISKEYKTFEQAKSICQECEVFKCYKQVVSSEGNANNPTFMIVAEAPGSTEVEKKRPLIGKAGQRLREELREFGFNKKNTVLTNVIPCRPENNKFPSDQYLVSRCMTKWLVKEISILKPKIIILCGATPLFYLAAKTGVASNRGKWIFSDRFKAYMLATWHPSYVLRCQNDPEKQNVPIEFKNDIKKVALEWQFAANDHRLGTVSEETAKKFTSPTKPFLNFIKSVEKEMSQSFSEEDLQW